MQTSNLPPQDMPDLAKGGSGAEDDSRVVELQEPENGYGGAETLTQAIARLDRDPPVDWQGRKHLLLLAPQAYSQNIAGEI